MANRLQHSSLLTAWQGRKGYAGFTMVELIIVVLILGVLAVTALPFNATGINAVVLARQLMMDVRLAQSYAMNRGSGYSINSTSSNSYEIRQPPPTPPPVVVGDTMPGTATTLPDASLSAFNIFFTALGVPVDDQNVPLVGATITVTVGGQSSTVTITGTTGQVTQP